MSWWEALAFGTFEAWLTQAVRNPMSERALKLKPRLMALRNLLNQAFRTWGWE